MKKPRYGPSIYYASDKNVFDALNQHKVDAATISELFMSRNVIVSKRTPRDELADSFSRLNHDFYDHQRISERLGVVPRRERITSMGIDGVGDKKAAFVAINQIKQELEEIGDVVLVSRQGADVKLTIQYAVVDYKKSEFAQVQVRDGIIELIDAPGGYIVRNSKNEIYRFCKGLVAGQA